MLDIDELDYYMLYIDSLGKVRGSELPKLPDLSSEEQRRLELLLKNERLIYGIYGIWYAQRGLSA